MNLGSNAARASAAFALPLLPRPLSAMARSWAFTACCALSIFLVLLPSPSHIKARNTGTLLYIGWTVVGNTIFLVNSIIWNGNFETDPAPVWCDIATKLIIGMSVGLTAASLCINRRLYDIASIKSVTVDSDARRRRIIVDMLLGIFLPMLVMALSYVVQSNRYNILEDFGCWPATYPTLLAVPLVLMWPIIISVASFIYAGLSIRAFLRARRQLSQALNNSTGINMSQYFRLLGLSSGEMLFSLPLSIYILYLNLQTRQIPWISWQDTHYKFSVVQRVPIMFIKMDMTQYNVMMLNQWALPAGGYLFFLWFGLAREAQTEYKRVFYFLMAPFGIKPSPPKPTVIRSQSTWASRLTSGISSNGRQDTTVAYPTLPEVGHSETTDEKTSTELAESEYKAGHSSPV
ncbi:a-factor receptor [Ceratobasidium sp. UAMH 11750]|nr:a-factor receptor [Ceratobasidium sp. UAMH 11750]